MGSIQPPRIKKFSVDAPLEDILAAMYEDGAVQIASLVSLDDVEKIKADINRNKKTDKDISKGEIYNAETETVYGLAAKSPAAVEAVIQHPMVKAVREDALTRTTSAWFGDVRHTATSKPLLSCFFSSRVAPGAPRQGLHRDDQDHHVHHTRADPRDSSIMFCGVALSKVTKENGATEVIPGSWAWDDERKPEHNEATYAEMDIGDCTLMMGHTYHGAGGNSTKDQFRHLLISLWCPGIYRTEENQFLAVPREIVQKYPEDVQDVLGWRASVPYLGWHEFTHPFNLFREKKEPLGLA